MTRKRKHLRYTFPVLKRRTTYWYFRHPRVGVKPLPGQPGDAKFHQAYGLLLAQADQLTIEAEQREDERSVRWLKEAYMSSDEWGQLRSSTRRDYTRELERLCAMAGDLPFAKLTRAGVLAMRKRVKAQVVNAMLAKAEARRKLDEQRVKEGLAPTTRRKPPKVTDGARTADYFVAALSAMMGWAVQYENVERNPVEGTRKLKNKRNVERRTPWTEEQIVRVVAEAPRHIADGVVLGLYTGQRLLDCVKMTKATYVAPHARVRQLKTNTLVDVWAVGPLKELLERRCIEIDATKEILTQADGRRYSERLFSEHLRHFLDGLGYENISFHGLKYSAAATLNDAGCTVATIVSVIGNSTYQLAIQYLATREEQKRAAVAMEEASANRQRKVQTKS